jgi:RNA polymerase sigma-70 factor (ECF subfamily)
MIEDQRRRFKIVPGGAAPEERPGASAPAYELDEDEARAGRDLATRVTAGDAQAETELVQRYARGLRFFLRRHAHSAAIVDDLFQETFTRVIERLRRAELEQPERLAGFIHGTARNLVRSGFREMARRGSVVVVDGLDGCGALRDRHQGPLARLMRDEQVLLVRELIRALPQARDRQILARFYLADEDKLHICADLGISALHFNRVLFRARQRFKALLERKTKEARP